MTSPTRPPQNAGPVARRPALWGDSLGIAGVALALRVVVALLAAGRFPPAADGVYYERIAERIGHGLGYTWLWPDGVVTYAAHYPVGYPALVGAAYAAVGFHLVVAMWVNAIFGAIGALAAHRLALGATSRAPAALGGFFVALHPSLVAYTPALMTEGVTAALVIAAVAMAARARDRGTLRSALALGLVVGVATLVRPQTIVLAPLLAALAAGALDVRAGPRDVLKRIMLVAGAATLGALLVCAPWTARNCVRMKQCALVSVNGGWNLLIGADPASTGSWSPVKVPDACREVFDEAKKDTCFGEQARLYIAHHPGTWLSLVPAKLAATFDHAAIALSYLHASNPRSLPDGATRRLAIVETAYERLLVLLVLVGAARGLLVRGRAQQVLGGCLVVGLAASLFLVRNAWPATVLLPAVLLLVARVRTKSWFLLAATALVIAVTAVTHAVFFGAARYGMVVFPLIATVAPLAFDRRAPTTSYRSGPLRGRWYPDAWSAFPPGPTSSFSSTLPVSRPAALRWLSSPEASRFALWRSTRASPCRARRRPVSSSWAALWALTKRSAIPTWRASGR